MKNCKIKSWCDELPDKAILSAKKPRGYVRNIYKWPKNAWKRWEFHAYHCKVLAAAMLKAGKWIGRPSRLLATGKIDGNHRLRVAQLLRDHYGVQIIIPLDIWDGRKE
jgi:hypothetical protein